jgi:shikimate kinase
MNERRIVIVGFMGSGKTTVAEALVRRLGCRMIDLDLFITRREGRPPAQIIEQDGETAFRAIETNTLHDLFSHTDARVIALGGGTWTIDTNRDLIAQHDCITVWLDAPFELCWNRITRGGESIRPLAPDQDRARELYQRRRSSYELAALRVELDGNEDVAEVAAQIEFEIDSQ